MTRQRDPEVAVTVDGLEKTYGSGDDAVRAVDDVSFSVDRGTVVGLLGPNGAGKTTTIKSMLGLVEPDAGTVTVEGVDVHADQATAYRHMGAMLEGARNVYWRLTVRENLDFFAALSGSTPTAQRERHDRLLQQLDIADKADTPVKELSRGMKQKVILAATLARDASVVFLDEPTLGLDVESSLELRRELRRMVDEESMTVVLSSHDMDVIEDVCDRVVILNEGEVIADDAVDELLALFRTNTYRVTLAAPVRERTRRTLRDRFDAGEFEETGDRVRFSVTADGAAFYDLMDHLRDAGCDLLGVTEVEPDMEDVFLGLTGAGPDAEGATTTRREAGSGDAGGPEPRAGGDQ